METKNVFVSRTIIKHYLPHPEYYGEALVELENGIVTDVYTNESGELFSPTNDEKLIQYLNMFHEYYPNTYLFDGEIAIRTIAHQDLSTVHEWLYEDNLTEETKRLCLEYISHANTMKSQMFITLYQSNPTGLISYQQISDQMLVFIKQFDFINGTDDQVDTYVHLMMNDLKKRFLTTKFVAYVLENDCHQIEILVRHGFIRVIDDLCNIPILGQGIKRLIKYELITESHKNDSFD